MTLAPDITAHPARVLVVDDEPHNRHLLEVMLGAEGYILQSAASGAEALALVALEPPDLVLLDVMMPEMSGYDVAARLKADPLTKNIPIIMVTVRDDREAKMLGLGVGAEDFLSKPVDRAELRVRVRNLLRLKAYGDYHDRYSQMLETEVGSRTAHLLQSEARYRRIVETSNEGVWVVDADGKTSFMNARMAQMLGADLGEVVGMSPGAFLFEDAAAAFAASLEGMKAGDARQLELRFRRLDGSTLWSLLEVSPIFAAGGAFEGVLAMVMDVSARHDAEEALRASMRIAELSAAVGVALTQGGALSEVLQRCVEAIVACTGAACARIWTFDARRGALHLQATAGPCKAPEGSAPLSETLLVSTSRSPQLTNDAIHDPRIGDHAWVAREGLVAFAGHPLLVSGELVGVITVFAREPLSAVVVEGLGSVANEIAIGVHRHHGEALRVDLEGHLRQAQKMEAIGRLAGGVAHDFNNVLSVILSYADLMLDVLAPSDPMREDVDEIRKAGNRAADLTRQLLMFSRQQVLAPRVINLNDLLSTMDKMLQRILGEDVRLVFLGGSALGRVRADSTSIEQVVMNLVVNARDAMPTGGTLTIETANVDLDDAFARLHVGAKPGPHVCLTVSDTGTGMDAAILGQIFEPFFTTKSVDKGTGLGLAMVFGITQQSGGCLSVSSEVGVGTTFEVYFPRVDTQVDVAPPPITSAQRRGTETILVVDDDEQVRQVVNGILRRSGYRVIDAKHAGEALLHCEQYPGVIDLLLTDVVMPQMSGPELAKRLAKDRPDMKLMCMSGYTDDSILRHGIEGTEIAYLQKPFTPETLTRKVREVLDAS